MKECFELTFKAFDVAETWRVPVIVLMDEIIGHMREKVILPDPSTLKPVRRAVPPSSPAGYKPYAADPDGGVPLMAPFGEGYRWHVTGLFHDESGRPSGKGEVADASCAGSPARSRRPRPSSRSTSRSPSTTPRSSWSPSAPRPCPPSRAVRRARREGIKAGMLRLKSVWPFPDALVARVASRARRIIVPEMNLGQLALEVERAAARR